MREEKGMANIFIGDELMAVVEYRLGIAPNPREPQFGEIHIDDTQLAFRLFNDDRPIIMKREGRPDVEIILREWTPGADELPFRIGRQL